MSKSTLKFTTFTSPNSSNSKNLFTINHLLCSLFFSRFLNSKPQTPSPKPNFLSGPEVQHRPQAKQAPSSPFDLTSFLCAAMKEERLKTDSSCLAMTEAEQRDLYETIRHALHSLRKYKVYMSSTPLKKCYIFPRDCRII